MGLKESFKKIFVKKEEIGEESDYLDLGIEEYEDEFIGEKDARMYIKTAELTGLYDIPDLKKEIYAGNILVLDISMARQDQVVMEKAIKDLKSAAYDVGGDIAGLSDNQVIVAPVGIKIERKKMSRQ